MILFSLLFLDEKSNNMLDSTVRSTLWLKASGASQYIDTFSNYEVQGEQLRLNYFQCLKDLVPVIPNPSIATILYDKHRMKFDIETIEKDPFIANHWFAKTFVIIKFILLMCDLYVIVDPLKLFWNVWRYHWYDRTGTTPRNYTRQSQHGAMQAHKYATIQHTPTQETA